jgi:dipeptidyl-peptidase-4
MTSPAPPHPGFLRDFAETRGYMLGRPSRVLPTPDGRAVVFLRSPARSPEQGLYELELASGVERVLVTPAEVLGGAVEEISPEEQARRERQRITDRGFTWFALTPDGGRVLLSLAGRLFLVDRATRAVRALTEVDPAGAPLDPRFSPDGARVAFVRGGELFVVETAGTAPPRALTSGAGEGVFFGLAEFVAQEEMGRLQGAWWSPDGSRLAYAAVDERAVERFAIADPARPERAPLSFHYPRPGRANADVRLGLVSAVEPGETVWVAWDRARYPYLARVLWETSRAPLAILVQTRDQREAALLAIDERSGVTRPLIIERDPAWVNLDRDLPHWLPDGSGLLWASERSGARALELRRPDGSFVRELCGGQAGPDGPGGFLSLVQIGGDSRTLHVLVGDALTNRLVRLDLVTGARTAITRDRAEHAPQFCRDGSVFVDTRIAADALPETLVCAADGARLAVVSAVAEAPPFRVRLELGEWGGFNAALIRPRAFDPARRYPVVVHVYGGPHSLMVRADERHYLLDQWIADHGVIVACIDNRGTPRRGRAWERAVKGAFGDVPLDDQVAGLQALARHCPQMDLGRVGIYGWSFGGTMAALALLRRPDLFKVAVAGAPVVDWHDYDTHYTERYLDLPDVAPEAYRTANLLTYAATPGQVQRPLLLVHGTADDNVYFFHSMKLADALFRAGRRFELLPLPGVTHQIGDPVVRERLWGRIAGFLLSELGAASS